jgi:hypothetical protein
MPASPKHLVQQGGSDDDEGTGTADEDTGATREEPTPILLEEPEPGMPTLLETGATTDELGKAHPLLLG